jgi:hypothetical protein
MTICPFCHFDNEEGALFCEQCKSDLGSAVPVAHAEPVEGIPTAEPVTAEPYEAIPLPPAETCEAIPLAPAETTPCAAALPAASPAVHAFHRLVHRVGIDAVHFSVTGPASLTPGSSCILDVWAHLEEQRQEVITRAREALGGREPRIRSKAGVPVARGTLLAVHLRLPGFSVEDPEDSLRWEGTIGNASFLLRVPPDLRPGAYPGTVQFYAGALRIARLHFTVEVGDRAATADLFRTREQRQRTAFASYASLDRDAVLARVQGIQKALPGLDVFLDVASLRSGQRWQERLRKEVTGRDVFYLFWSAHARESQWVDWEWRTAFGARGVDYIDPVPLAPPEIAPPPAELAAHLHFND